MTDKRCATCRYDGFMSGDCYYPKPQDGTGQDFMAVAAMPDDRGGGENCMQYSQHAKRKLDKE